MAGTMMIEAETEKQMEQLVAQEEGVLSQEEGLEILESPPPVSRGFYGRKAMMAMLALAVLGVVTYRSTMQQQPKVNHVKSFYSKLRRSSKIISLMGEHTTNDVMQDVGQESDGVLAGEEFEKVGQEIVDGDNLAPHQTLEAVEDLGLTPGQMEQVQGMFHQIDEDEDGEISETELGTLFTQLEEGATPAEIHEAFEMAGPEREAPMNLVNFKELANFQAQEGMPDEGGLAKMVLQEIDLDGDKKVSQYELYGFLSDLMPAGGEGALPVGVTVQDVVSHMMKHFDEDHDDLLDETELEHLLHETM